MKQQVLKAGLKEFTKTTKGNKREIFSVRHGAGNYWVYNGLLLNTGCFNLNYAVIHNVVSFSNVSKDEVFTIEPIIEQHKNIFGLP